MRHSLKAITLAIAALSLAACGDSAKLPVKAGTGRNPQLPAPNPTMLPTLHIATAIGWKAGEMPTAASGLKVNAFARCFDHPRWVYVLPDGDVLVAETNAPPKPDDATGFRGFVQGIVTKQTGEATDSANRITLLRDTNGDGVADVRTTFISGLHSPFGMELVGNDFYVADSDALLRFTYHPGDTKIEGAGEKVVDLPAGTINHHWTKNVIASPDGSKLYVTVGSNSNVGENGMAAEVGRAAIWEVDPQAKTHRIFASGLRNPNGMAWIGGKLWVAVNERDEIGSDLVPDYITSVKDGAFYGWPYSYWGRHVDVRPQPPRPDLVKLAIAPDYAVGPHTASLGLASAAGAQLGDAFSNGLFVGQHGSWNRNPFSGYKVIFVPFANGKPSGMPVDVLTGFLTANDEAHGRPVGVAIAKDGALLVADDVGNTIWRVSKK